MVLEALGPQPIYLWSIIIHVAVYVVTLTIQTLIACCIRPRGVQYRTISEFLFSSSWVILSLESTVLFYMWSEMSGMYVLWLRLFISPILFHKVFGNPCDVLYCYLMRFRKSDGMVRNALIAQLLAIPVGVGAALLIWNLMAGVSDDYSIFLEKKLDYFLSVHPLLGFLIEATISFLMFMPGIFLPASIFFRVLENVFVVGLVYQFGVQTGAFMNPMVATACLLMWHSEVLGVWGLCVHTFVFFFGPLFGTLMAVKVARASSATVSSEKQD